MFLRLLLISFVSTSLYSQKIQQSIVGKVVDDSGSPLLGSTISIDNNSLITIANGNGEYVIKNIPTGKHIIKAYFMGFKTETQEINLSEKETLNINFSLEEDLESLEQVSITGKTAKTKLETKGFAVNVIETKEASLRNIQTNELLNTTVGVKIRLNGGLGSHAEYSLNGLSGKSISIFIDGIPISVYGSSFSLNSIPPAIIKNIEIYKGVVPGHLSSDALGGAINVVLKKGAKTNFNASVSYGSFNTFQANINGLYRFKKSGFTIKTSGFHNYSDNDYKVWGNQVKHTEVDGSRVPIVAKRFYDGYRSTGGMAQIGFTNVKWADQFLIGVTGSDDYKEVQHGAFMTANPYKGRFLESDALLANVTYLKKNFLTKGLDININGLIGERNRIVNDTVNLTYTWLGVVQQRPVDFSDPYGESMDLTNSWNSQQATATGQSTLLKIHRKVASVRSGVSYKMNKHHKVLLNHIYNGVDREDSDEMLSLLENTFQQTSDLYKNTYSLSYEFNGFHKKLKTNVFGKHYRQKVLNTKPVFNDSETEVLNEIYQSDKKYNGYGLAVSYAVLSNITMLFSTEKAIRLPSETEVFGDAGDNVIANIDVKPEISNNYNLGFRFGKFSIQKHGVTISTNLFSRNIKDLIGLPANLDDSGESDDVVQYDNFDKQTTSKGVELDLNYNYNNNLGFNFNLSRLSLKTKNIANQIVDVANVPLFTMNAGLRYSIINFIQKKSRLNLFYSSYFTDKFYFKLSQGSNTKNNDTYLIPLQFQQDFGLNYVFPKENFVLSFDVKNIFNKAVYDNRSVQKPGRAFYVKLNYTINKF